LHRHAISSNETLVGWSGCKDPIESVRPFCAQKRQTRFSWSHCLQMGENALSAGPASQAMIVNFMVNSCEFGLITCQQLDIELAVMRLNDATAALSADVI